MKLTSFNTDVENVSKLPDRPNIESGYTAEALKEVFDKAGVDIKEYINGVLIEELASKTTGKSGADRIGSGAITTVPGDTVQAKLRELSNQINGLANQTIPDGSLTADKLAPEVSDFIENLSYRAHVFRKPGEHAFEITRTGIYKITAVGGGAGGGVMPNDASRLLGGGAGAVSVTWTTIYEGTICFAQVGAGGKGLTVDGTSLVSNAQDGGVSYLDVHGYYDVYAEGGKFGLGTRALAENGLVNIKGGYPKVSDYSGGEVHFAMGGDCIYGNGGAFEGDEAGIGGGGYAGCPLGGGAYSQGYDGGNGLVIVEFVE